MPAHHHRLVAAIDAFARARQGGAKSKRHIAPLADYVAAELVSLGVPRDLLHRGVAVRGLCTTHIDLAIGRAPAWESMIGIITQGGSVRKNLNNRRRDLTGDYYSLRRTFPQARIGLVYVLRASAEATTKGRIRGTSPVDELIAFLPQLSNSDGVGGGLVNRVALLVANVGADQRVQIVPVPPPLQIGPDFFRYFAQGSRR